MSKKLDDLLRTFAALIPVMEFLQDPHRSMLYANFMKALGELAEEYGIPPATILRTIADELDASAASIWAQTQAPKGQGS